MGKTFCLLPAVAKKFKQALKDGTINPEKLNAMTSSQRRDFLAKFVGANASKVNAMFESKLLLKSQKRGMITWAKRVSGISKEIKREMIDRITKLDKVLEEKDLGVFLEDLVSEKVGFPISKKETEELSTLAKDANEKKQTALSKLDKDGKWKSEADKNKYGIDFGASKVAFNNKLNELRLRAEDKRLINPLKEQGLKAKGKAVYEDLKLSTKFIAENSRSLVASFDNSFFGRQGRKAATRPATSKLWAKNFLTSFKDGFKTMRHGSQKGDQIMDSVKAEIFSRENYLNGMYERGQRLDVGVREEEFPTSLPERIPLLGRFFKASEVMYEAGATRLRADIADTFYKLAEKTGNDLSQKEAVGSVNEIVNIMTGRGSLGSFENAGKQINNVFFSAKFAMSQIQSVTRIFNAKTPFARKQAALNLGSLIVSSAIITAMTQILFGEKRTENDPRSANFGKVKIGGVWVDTTGGEASYLTLAERIRRQSFKNTNTGVITKLNEGYGSPDGMDVFFSFAENKTSPIASVVKDVIKQRTFDGEKPTIINETKSLTTPIIFSTGVDAFEARESRADVLTAVIADGLGFSANSFVYGTNWETSSSKKIKLFKELVGDKKFKKANKLFNKRVSKLYVTLRDNKKYQALSNDDKKKTLTNTKNKIKKQVFQEFGVVSN